jgi:glucuronate isomerase
MTTYLSEDFLLNSKTACTLYHEYAATMPVIDYHCHLSPQEIAENKKFKTITEAWLKGDHYKWRAMRTNGIDEQFITGNASDEIKFMKWAETLPRALRNPLYDWTHLELQRYFGIKALLSEDTADSIYKSCNEQLEDDSFSAQNLLKRMNVRIVCTTDDPVDDLCWHEKMKVDEFEITALPTFRPDKSLAIEDPVAYNRYIDSLAKASDTGISSYTDLLTALDKRHLYFHEHGCRSADHAVETLSTVYASASEMNSVFSRIRSGKAIDADLISAFKVTLLLELCRMNHKRGWAQQIHMGVIRNARSIVYKKLGPDTGVDCIGDFSFARPLAVFLDTLDSTQQLTKTILFNINPGDNELLVVLAGVFQEGPIPGKIQLGPAWWFLDQKNGMKRHLDALSVLGLLSRFVGMTTDSRSLLSFPRHEYFRRILCNLLGEEIERGELPGDINLVGHIICDMCYTNAEKYFGYTRK